MLLMDMLMDVLKLVFGSKMDRDMRRMKPIIEAVNALRESMLAKTDVELRAMTPLFRERLVKGETLDAIMPEAFAVVREAAHRVLGEGRMVYDPYLKKEIPFMAHFDAQIRGGIALHKGSIAEMRTGEGKTQVAALAAYLNALEGKGVHVITVNDYLAKRDSEWMGRIYGFLGLTVGCLDKSEPHTPERRAAYLCDITYGTNSEFGFDYLRDNMAISPDYCVQRGLNYAIIDEVDNILVDEARTPLIISGPVTKSNREYDELKPRVARVVQVQLQHTQKLMAEAEKLLESKEHEYEAGIKLLAVKRGAPKNSKLMKLSKEQGVARIMKAVETDYLRDKRLHEIDEELFYTLEESGHSAELTEKGRELISGSNPDFFVVPDLAEELARIDQDPALSIEEKAQKKDALHKEFAEHSERIHCIAQLLVAYSLKERDVDYVVQDGQVLIVDEFTGRILQGRRWSDGLHQAVEAKEGVKVAGENQTLATITYQNLFKLYKKISGMTGTAATEAAEFNEIYKLDVVTIPTNRPMVRNDWDDEIYKTHHEKYNAIVKEIEAVNKEGRPILVGTTSIEKSELISKLLMRTGIQHEVLNAKQHAREATIVAQAGRLGGVTIATNMAGRGTDILLGGNFEIMVKNELVKEGINPDDLTAEDKRARYAKLHKQLQEEHDKVVALGGLHIIGTERHEARRIDNQLRGRAGRQGDPGSSKFFLSLDDDLMRIFGSERLAGIMDRLGVQDGEVISHGMVTASISNAQKRVEGRNFEARKHLKEYDDVMNLQRSEIYGMRQRILRGEDIKNEILGQVELFLGDAVEKCARNSRFPEEWDLKSLSAEVQLNFGLPWNPREVNMAGMTPKDLFEHLLSLVKQRYEEKEQRFGGPLMRQFERGVFLMVIDNLWKDHLYEMDHLKEGVQYRAFAQKNPLYEYQREALIMFNELRSTIAREVASYIYRLEAAVRQEDRMGLNTAREQHAEYDVYADAAGGQRPPPEPVLAGVGPRRPMPQQQMITNRHGQEGGKPAPVRSVPHVGRNEPCPCGSGKKYKKCHGINA
jgi:preprotein translocase subunit SecA